MLSLRVKFLNIVSLVLVGYDELAGLLERNAMRLTSVVEKMSSADAKDRFERFRGVIEPWMIRGMRTRLLARLVGNQTCVHYLRVTRTVGWTGKLRG